MINQEPPKPQMNQEDNQEGQETQELSIRDSQKQVGNRVDQQGQNIDQPRLAQEQRPREDQQQSDGMVANYAKDKGKKWLTAGIIGGTTLGAGGFVGWLIG